MSTDSPAGRSKPAATIRAARPDSPGMALTGSMVVVPSMLPAAKARATRISHPTVAVFQCAALHIPIRDAMLSGGRPRVVVAVSGMRAGAMVMTPPERELASSMCASR